MSENCQEKDCKLEADKFYCVTCLTVQLQNAYDEGFEDGKIAANES